MCGATSLTLSMAKYYWNVPQERESALCVYEEIFKRPGSSFKDLLKGHALESLRPSLELLIEHGKIRREIVPGFDDPQDAERFYPVHSKVED